MSSDPRVHKPRLPKAYTDQQLAFLKRYSPSSRILGSSSFFNSSLPEFERRSHGSIRGDAKKFALERAQDFIVRFGLPDEFVGVEEPESRFKEVLNLLIFASSFSMMNTTANLQLVQEHRWADETQARGSSAFWQEGRREG